MISDSAVRLDRIKVYQPIIWNGWYQSLNELDFSQNINIRRLKNTLGVLKGHVKLYTSKGGKLRLALDISMLEENKKRCLIHLNKKIKITEEFASHHLKSE